MTLAYVPPGVTVNELTNISVAPLIALPGSVCLVGLASGGITVTEAITLTRTSASLLTRLPPTATMGSGAIQTVLDAVNPSIAPSGYVATTDYTFSATNHTLTRVVSSNTLASGAALAATSFTLSAGSTPPVTTPPYVVRLESAPVTVASVTTTVGSFNVTVASGGFTSVTAGMAIAGTGVAPGALVTSVVGNTLIMSQAATASGTVTLSFTTTELATVSGVAGQIVSIVSGLANAYLSGANVTWGHIPDGNSVYVTYTYTPADYFQPIRLNSMVDVQKRFGNAWNATNTAISSGLSYAASLVFQNGASNVVLQPLFTTTAGVAVQPNVSGAGSNSDPALWAAVYNGLLDLQDINLIVPVVGQSQANVTDSVQSQIEQATQDFVYNMSNLDIDVEAVMGEDSSQSSSVAQEATLQTHAQALIPRYNAHVTEQLVFVNTSQFSVATPTSSILVGGQFMAAAIAGLLASNAPATGVTRVPVSGFQAVTDFRTLNQKNSDAQNGMLVIENKGQLIQIRHAITMDGTSSATRELNVVRAKQFIIASVRDTLDTQIVGKIAADSDAPTIVNNVVIGTLQDLQNLGQLSTYANVQSAIVTFDPTTMAVSFDYAPLFLVNYINVAFTLDLTNKTVTATSSAATA